VLNDRVADWAMTFGVSAASRVVLTPNVIAGLSNAVLNDYSNFQ